jgi:hypothetical protein
MILLENGLVVSNEGFRSVDPETGILDVAVYTKGRTNPKTGKYVKPSEIFPDSLTRFDEMPRTSYINLSENDKVVVSMIRNDKSARLEGYKTSTAYCKAQYLRLV